MNKTDLLILAGAGAMVATAGALWFTREPESIALEDAPAVAQQMVAESTDPAIRQAQAEGRQIRLRKLKPSSDVPTFQSEVEGMGGVDESMPDMTDAEMYRTVQAMQAAAASDRAARAAR